MIASALSVVWSHPVRRNKSIIASASSCFSSTFYNQRNSREDLAAVLRVCPPVSEAELKAAFIRRAKECHPDVSRKSPIEAKQEFVLVAKAYNALLEQRRTPANPHARSRSEADVKGFSSTEDVADFARRSRARRQSTSGASQSQRSRSNRDMMGGASVGDSIVDLEWWLNLPVELSAALDFAYWGPHFEVKESPSIWGFPYAFEAEHRVHPDASDNLMELVSGRQVLGYVRVDSTPRVEDISATDNRKRLRCAPASDSEGSKSSRSNGGIRARQPPGLELVFMGKRIAIATVKPAPCHLATGHVVITVQSTDPLEDPFDSSSRKQAPFTTLGTIRGLPDVTWRDGVAWHEVRDSSGEARGHVGTWKTPGVERSVWFTAGHAGESSSAHSSDQQGGGLAGATARAMAMGLPLIECQASRAWLPSPDLWLWAPRSEQHARASSSFEIAKGCGAGSAVAAAGATGGDFGPLKESGKRLHPALYVFFSAYRALAKEAAMKKS